jgi:predicted Zn-dependent protease
MKKFVHVVGLVTLLLLLDSCAKNPVTGRRDFMLMSTDQEIAMGQQSDPEIQQFFGIYDDPKLQRFIEEKGQQMAAVSHRKDLQYHFKIVDSPVVNAFAVPGGYVYFTRGIMAHFNNEAEFAGVLGHEIGHITARHSAKQYSNAMLAQVGLAAGMIFAPELAQFGELAGQGVQLLFLKFGRDAERQSDKLGVEYSTKIGYDAEEMAGFFATLDRLREDAGQEAIPNFLSTHPNPADRERSVSKMAKEWKAKEGKTLQVNEDSYLRMIDGLIYGEDPKQGFVENNVFYHPELKFQFSIPTQWAVQNTPQAVQMASQDGKAIMMLTLGKGNSLEDAAQAMLQNYGLTVVESKRDQVNGLPALLLVADQSAQQQQGQQGQSLRVLSYLIQYGENIYMMIGASRPNDFNSYARVFQNSMGSFNVLRDQTKINKQPERIRVREVPQSGSLAQAFRSMKVEESRMSELAILNGLHLEDQVARGKLLKVIE